MNKQELIEILVCPQCKGVLYLAEKGSECGFGCAVCGLVYPICDEIPILLIDKATPEEGWRATSGVGQCES